jgi:hypothetical protein
MAFDSFHEWGSLPGDAPERETEGPAFGIFITGYDEITFQMGNYRDPARTELESAAT